MALLRPPKNDAQTAPWFSPRQDSFWFAAGLKATAFQLLAVDAVVVDQLNPYLQLGIYGVAVCDVPSIQSRVKFAHAELGIAYTLDVRAGTFKLDAQLSPRSFILDPACHLTGGMALYAWFAPAVAVPPSDDGSGLPGSWVLTIGGYHQAFNWPQAYPNPPRLGINWSLGPLLRISGEAYFAVTPRVCMAGGKLSASLTLGALKSGTNASSVAASFLSGAVDDSTDDDESDEWVSLGGTTDDAFFKPKADKGKTSKPFLFNCASGLVPQTKIKGQEETKPTGRQIMDEEKKETWLVQLGPFTFTVMTAFPSSKGTLKDQRPNPVQEKQEMKKLNKSEYNNIFALPMQLKSTMTSDVTVEAFQAKEKAVLLRLLKPKRKRREGYFTLEEEEDDRPGIWKVQPILKDVPCSLWAKCTSPLPSHTSTGNPD